jgi:hypothetical protein
MRRRRQTDTGADAKKMFEMAKTDSTKSIVYKRVVENYRSQIARETFNGIKLQEINECLGDNILRPAVVDLATERKLDVISSEIAINPHIKRLQPPNVDVQLQYFDIREKYHTCLYPTPKTIEREYDLTFLNSKPFTLEIAKGRAVLEPTFFEISVLDRYRLDPRYEFAFHEYAGRISMAAEHYASPATPERDKTFLRTFGLGLDNESSPLVCVFLRYLSEMTPEHQQHWQTFVSQQPARMHENYYKPSVLGEFYENNSGIAAIRISLDSINSICKEVWGAELFRNSFPKNVHYNLSPFMRSTKSDYLIFAHELDKLISENINSIFFHGKSEPYTLTTYDDGIVERKPKGTLTQLEEWLFSGEISWHDIDPARCEIIEPLKRVRRLRQPSAHSLIENEFDARYTALRREILGGAVFALANITLVLRKHPRAPKFKLPSWFEEGRIEVI